MPFFLHPISHRRRSHLRPNPWQHTPMSSRVTSGSVLSTVPIVFPSKSKGAMDAGRESIPMTDWAFRSRCGQTSYLVAYHLLVQAEECSDQRGRSLDFLLHGRQLELHADHHLLPLHSRLAQWWYLWK